MKRLFILRHAKSSWSNDGVEDHDRPLNDRGREAARAMGGYAQREGLLPDVVLASTAKRAQQTAKKFLQAAGHEVQIISDKNLYLASPKTLLECAKSYQGSEDNLMLVAHNPGMHALAVGLADQGGLRRFADIAAKYPTGALSVFVFDVDSWQDLRVDAARLIQFTRPRDL